MDLAHLISLVNTYFRAIYDGTKDIDDRRRMASVALDNLLSLSIIFFRDEAIEYSKKRDEEINDKMEKIQQKVFDFLNTIVPIDWTIKKTSSFSSKTHLSNESDIDFTILIHNMTDFDVAIARFLFKANGFTEQGEECAGKPDHYYVFSKIIDGIEIELKVRDDIHCKRVMLVHQYMDNNFDERMKPFVTYLKKLLKGTPAYSQFKYIVFENALHMTGWKGELFGSHIRDGYSITN